MKSKIFAVVLAVMALVSCMCIPALAATNLLVQNGISFSASHWSDDNGGELQYLEIEHGVTYTITTDPSITKLDLWVYKTSSRANASLTFVDGVCEYVCTDTNVKGIVILCGDAESRPTVTVSWPRPPEPTLFDYGFSWLGFLVTGGLSVLDMLVSHPVTQLLIAGTLAVSVFFIIKFLPKEVL